MQILYFDLLCCYVMTVRMKLEDQCRMYIIKRLLTVYCEIFGTRSYGGDALASSCVLRRMNWCRIFHNIHSITYKYIVNLNNLSTAIMRVVICYVGSLSEPEMVYKFRKIIGKNDFPYHFKKIVVRYKKIGYIIDVLRQTSCLVVNPIKVNSFAYLFNCKTVGRASD